jgi:hypothetical protein
MTSTSKKYMSARSRDVIFSNKKSPARMPTTSQRGWGEGDRGGGLRGGGIIYIYIYLYVYIYMFLYGIIYIPT